MYQCAIYIYLRQRLVEKILLFFFTHFNTKSKINKTKIKIFVEINIHCGPHRKGSRDACGP